ncbi:c2H2-type zinc-finger domain-containing protein [Ditylenchus destructor]|uniref:C2H2-type zinc-finger domain-containing protein n=1 Tax=Ditylenchus destructor TaxID=166010 RepID=A0AAD4QWM6_9BILA|nr:c2H2-type zinc-finger domain-containing protein [Ditylenchus destructor]
MKTKINFLNCPICNTVVDNELDGLCIDKFFQKILSDVSGATEIEILSDGTFRVAPSHSAPIIPKVIDDEGPYVPEHSTTRTVDVKSESCSDVDDIEELGSVSSLDIDGEANQSNVETQSLHLPDTSTVSDTSQAVDHSTTHIDDTKSETDINVDNAERLDSISSYHIGSGINVNGAEAQILHDSDTSMASDTNQAEHSSNTKAGSRIDEKRFKCTQCSYESARKDNLEKHMSSHSANVRIPALKQVNWRITSVLTLERSLISVISASSPLGTSAL